MNAFQSTFAKHLVSYVQLRRQLGLRFEAQEAVLRAFDHYAHEHDHRGPLTEQFALGFALSVRDPTTTAPARRYLVVRHFAEYLATYDPGTPRLDPKAILRRWQQPPAYIFTPQEIEQLLRQATAFPKRPPLSNVALRTMIGLAASTGLRPGEVLGLDQVDVDLHTGILVIRRSKLGKDRLVPVHSTTLDVLRAYAAERDQLSGAQSDTAFFLNGRMRRYQTDNLDYLFRRLVRSVDLHPPRGARPTFRSLRHTFAVRRLVTWHRAGAKVQALLPALATYMGHVHYSSTAYYLTATAEMLGVAAERLFTQEVNHDQEK
jgi:integrase